jgi:hypothetical protein
VKKQLTSIDVRLDVVIDDRHVSLGNGILLQSLCTREDGVETLASAHFSFARGEVETTYPNRILGSCPRS